MGISFLGQGLSMAIGGSIAFFLSWRGVFLAYSILAAVVTILFFTVGRRIPSYPNPNSQFLAPYLRLLSTPTSLALYLSVFLEGMFIVGTFSYLGAFTEHQFHFNYLMIGLVLTAFGAAAVIAGRLSGRLAGRWGRKRVLLTGLAAAALADLVLYFAGKWLLCLVLSVALLGLGFMLAHSTFLTVATEFAARARGAAMSLVAFCFMGGGGVGTALGGRLIANYGYSFLFAAYGLALLILISFHHLRLVSGDGKNFLGVGAPMERKSGFR